MSLVNASHGSLALLLLDHISRKVHGLGEQNPALNSTAVTTFSPQSQLPKPVRTPRAHLQSRKKQRHGMPWHHAYDALYWVRAFSASLYKHLAPLT